MARILRICDVFCALTTDRSYRRAFDLRSAMEIMIDEAEDYDMQAFLAFQRVLHSDEFREMDMLTTVLTPLQKKHLPLFVREAEIV
jgi:HD-GYP domain-containing protein (c-di-GMP phosphodiesterase class II)